MMFRGETVEISEDVRTVIIIELKPIKVTDTLLIDKVGFAKVPVKFRVDPVHNTVALLAAVEAVLISEILVPFNRPCGEKAEDENWFEDLT